MCKPKRLAELVLSGIELVITDECHHAAAVSYRRILQVLGSAFMVGVIATPLRMDEQSIAELFAEPVYVATLPQMVLDGWLTDLRGVQVGSETNLDTVKIRAGDFAADDLAAAVDTHARNDLVVRSWRERASDRLTLAFCANVEHARHLAEAFTDAGVVAASVSGATPQDERERILTDFAAGRIQVLCNCYVLTEGYDCPAVGCIVLARPTRSQSPYIQMAGRGARPAPGKRDCLVLDICDVTKRHGLVQLPELIGRTYPAQESSPRWRSAHAGRKQEQEDLDEVSLLEELEQGPTRLHDVDVLKVWNWRHSRDGGYVLDLATGGTISLELGPAGYTALWQSGYWSEHLTVRPMPLGWAQGIAEQAAEHLEGGRRHLVSRQAPWRSEPASEKQKAALHRLRIHVRPGITKGEASDLLQVAFAKMGPNQTRPKEGQVAS